MRGLAVGQHRSRRGARPRRASVLDDLLENSELFCGALLAQAADRVLLNLNLAAPPPLNASPCANPDNTANGVSEACMSTTKAQAGKQEKAADEDIQVAVGKDQGRCPVEAVLNARRSRRVWEGVQASDSGGECSKSEEDGGLHVGGGRWCWWYERAEGRH